jgi:putative transcriptional regulator
MSRLLETVHKIAKGLHKAGAMDGTTMREFDVLCLPAVKPLTPAQIKRIRLRQNVSQPVFAAYLNLEVTTIQKWEAGAKQPSGSSLKLLHLVKDKGLEVLA